MKKWICLNLLACFLINQSSAQELYVYTEPASNMPAHSITAKVTDHYVASDKLYKQASHRVMPEVQFGFSKKLMMHVGATFSNMHNYDFRYESWNAYAKYRFLSKDDIHSHFRMAAFVDGSSTRSPFHFEEINLMGDKSGIQLGLIATQLWNKLAVSGTVSHTQVLDKSRNNKVIYIPRRLYQSINYSLSAGYLVLPKVYSSYKQTNFNIYMEFLGERSLDAKKYCLDMAPALQLIFNSNTKLNLGTRFQLAGNMSRMMTSSWQFSLERTFLGALKRSK